jgi:hypothetical protein
VTAGARVGAQPLHLGAHRHRKAVTFGHGAQSTASLVGGKPSKYTVDRPGGLSADAPHSPETRPGFSLAGEAKVAKEVTLPRPRMILTYPPGVSIATRAFSQLRALIVVLSFRLVRSFTVDLQMILFSVCCDHLSVCRHDHQHGNYLTHIGLLGLVALSDVLVRCMHLVIVTLSKYNSGRDRQAELIISNIS